MESYKKIILLIAVVFLTGCKAKQNTIIKTEVVRDSIFIDKVVKIKVPSVQLVEVEKPCDSLGNLKPFKTVIKTEKVFVKVQGKDNVITAEINLDSIKEATVKEYKSKNVEKHHKEIIIKYKVPKWCWWLLGVNIAYLLYILRRRIPYLNLIP